MTRQNNLDLLRLIFALFVIVTHSYPLSGNLNGDALARLTGGQMVFSSIGVDGFFIISGYLIFGSFKARKSVADYLWKRCVRIFPGLFVVLVATVIAGYFVSSSSFHAYFWSTGSVKTYILNNLSLYSLQPSIEGVFEKNPAGSTINGSLWTLVYEFALYLIVMGAGFSALLGKRAGQILTAIIVAIAGYFSHEYRDFLVVREAFWGINAYYIAYFSSLFLFGSLLASLRFHEWRGLKLWCVASGLILLGSLYAGVYGVISHVALPIFVLSLGYACVSRASVAYARLGDLSYGVYIYAFPVQQFLMHFFRLDAIELMAATVPVTLGLAYLSWDFVEKRALRYKGAIAAVSGAASVEVQRAAPIQQKAPGLPDALSQNIPAN